MYICLHHVVQRDVANPTFATLLNTLQIDSMDFVDINGATLAYRLVGPANAPLFLTLHGGRGFGTPISP